MPSTYPHLQVCYFPMLLLHWGTILLAPCVDEPITTCTILLTPCIQTDVVRSISFVFVYMKSSFPKHDKGYSKNKMGLQCQCQVHRLCFGKKVFHIYTYAHVHKYKELFSKTWSPNLALAFCCCCWIKQFIHQNIHCVSTNTLVFWPSTLCCK